MHDDSHSEIDTLVLRLDDLFIRQVVAPQSLAS
jgi:hypothetical protein